MSKNVNEQELNKDQKVEEPIVEEAEPINKEKVVEGEVVTEKKNENHHNNHSNHHKKSCNHKHECKHNKKHHHKSGKAKKVMKTVGNAALEAAYVASVVTVTVQCLTNPISTIGLITKEGLEIHFEKKEKIKREQMIREEIAAERNATTVGQVA